MRRVPSSKLQRPAPQNREVVRLQAANVVDPETYKVKGKRLGEPVRPLLLALLARQGGAK